jgi:hypothetical protein
MRHSTDLPVLRMLPAEKLISHEDPDPRRVERLSQRIRAEGMLKNPPVVAAILSTSGWRGTEEATRGQALPCRR